MVKSENLKIFTEPSEYQVIQNDGLRKNKILNY